MIYTERKQDLFENTEGYYYAHCISADFALGAGIAVQFARRFQMRKKLIDEYGIGLLPQTIIDVKLSQNKLNPCILIDNVFNLVTKEMYYQKPTMQSMYASLLKMRYIADTEVICKIAMPKIGCGLDGLAWNEVKQMIIGVFRDSDIEILVCYL